MKVVLTEEHYKRLIKILSKKKMLEGTYPSVNSRQNSNNQLSVYVKEAWFNDKSLRDALFAYSEMNDPQKLLDNSGLLTDIGIANTTLTKKRSIEKIPGYKTLPTGSNITTKPPGTIKSQSIEKILSKSFVKVRYLHQQSSLNFTNDTIRNIYDDVGDGYIPASNTTIQDQIDEKVREILNRPKVSPLETEYKEYLASSKDLSTTIGGLLSSYLDDKGNLDSKSVESDIKSYLYKANVFGQTKQIQLAENASQHYMYRQGNISDSVVCKAFKDLNLKDAAQAYHYIMNNCLLPTGDDVELGIAHYFCLLTSSTAQHIDRTGTDIMLSDKYKIECKSSQSPNQIEKGLHASFPADDIDKYYVFVSNSGSAEKTQISIINSKLLRFILLIPDIISTTSTEETPAGDKDNRILHDYVNKYGNSTTATVGDFDWIEETIKSNSENIINNFIKKTTQQFKEGNAENFDDTVTFKVGNSSVMIRTQVSWGLSAEDTISADTTNNT